MDWSSLWTALLAFLGVLVAEFVKVKIKKLDNDAKRKDDLVACEAKHRANFDDVKKEFNERLDSIDSTLDTIRTEQTKISTTVKQLETKQDKYNNVIERTYKLEGSVDMLLNMNNLKMQYMFNLQDKFLEMILKYWQMVQQQSKEKFYIRL